MATIERIGLVLQLVHNTYNLMRNWRDNATDYKARAAVQGVNVGALAAIMVADADQFLARIASMTAAVTRNQTLVSNALTDLGLTLSALNTLKTTLEGVANHTKAASLTTTQAIIAEGDYILANVPNYERIW